VRNFLNRATIKHPKLVEVFKFLIIGGFSTIIDFLVMGTIMYLWQPHAHDNFFNVFMGGSYSTLVVVVATGAGFIAAVTFSYVFSILFVFSASDTEFAKSKRGFVVFAILASIGLSIHILGMYIGFDILGINEWFIKIFLTLVVLVYNFISRKKLIFRMKKEVPACV